MFKRHLEAEEEEARQLEVEYMRERQIPDEQTAFELAAERWRAEEDARSDAEFEIWGKNRNKTTTHIR